MSQLKKLFLSSTFIFILISPLFSQEPVKNYDNEWKQVAALKKKELPKSALEIVKQIYSRAKKENQEAQVIKALIAMFGLQSENRENNEVLSIKELENEIKTSKEVPAAILNSLLAQLYWNYYNNNRWKFYNRTETVGFNKDDISTWGQEDFFNRISSLYLASLKNEKLLQQTKLENYDAIIEKGNVRHLRPTLFDLLGFRALDFFENDERYIKEPAYAFTLDQAAAFDPAPVFVNDRFLTRDSLSLFQKALLLYQRLIAFHLHDVKPDALLDADLHRLSFVKDNSVHPDKDKLYLQAVERITVQYKDLPAAAQAWYMIAEFYDHQADQYKPYGDSTHRWDRVKAKEICEKIIQQKDSSEGRVNAQNLLYTINLSALEFTVEKVNVPDLPFRALVTYDNVSRLYLRIVKVDETLRKAVTNIYDPKSWAIFINTPATKTWQQNLPLPADYQEHKAEIRIDALPIGEYFIIASNDADIGNKNAHISFAHTYVSNISFINKGNNFFVLNRSSGHPLANAAIQTWTQEYDYKTGNYVKQKGKLYHADAKGYFQLDRQTSADKDKYYNYYYLFEITYKNDFLFLDDQVRDAYSAKEKDADKKDWVFLFTDRAIYRPGQTLFFKGIVINKDSKNNQAIVNNLYSTVVYLRNANGQDIDSLRLKTNDFGSFNGQFRLPSAGLNGQFSIYTKSDNGNAQLRVEEYKRPKFYVDFERITGTYKVNDQITLTGYAKAYAGNNIDGATVAYRVVRRPRFIYTWMFYRWWQPPTKQMEIAHGELKTGSDGKFTIQFTAIPDQSIDKKFEPVFDYSVVADVTDINGETRSGERSVSVSYKSIQLLVSLPERIPSDSLRSIFVRTQNLNAVYVSANLQVRFIKLKPENRLIRNRYWDRPDQFTMNKADYIQSFPHDEYDNETDMKSWERQVTIYDKRDTSREDGKWIFENVKLENGFYAVEITASGRKGEEVKQIEYLELYDEHNNKINRQEYVWSGITETTALPGTTVKVELGTAADSIYMVQQINKQQSVINADDQFRFTTTSISDEKTAYNFKINDTDRGGFMVNWIFIKDNRVYQVSKSINVPWSNKELKIEYASFRDKALPGSEERWKLKITGYGNEKVAAELLATMYDASLDQFVPHSLSQPSVWPYFYNYSSWNFNQNFSEQHSSEHQIEYHNGPVLVKIYDQLFATSELSNYISVRSGGIISLARLPRLALRDGAAPVGYDAIGNLKGVEVHTAPEKERLLYEKDTNPAPITSADKDGNMQIRRNFNETAFFFPELRTDSSGAIEFTFTLPDALTKWKFLALAHTRDAAFGSTSKEIVTQKDLMVQPNTPRFLREGDKIELSTKVVNMTDKELTGTAELQLFDATTNEPVDGSFRNMVPNQYFTVGPGQSEAVRFPIEAPYLFNRALVYRVIAKSGSYSDGEENVLPVLSNRILVTESIPLNMKGAGTKNITFEKLLKSGNSESLQHFGLTVEYTSNPAWYAIQALPYLMEFPYECAEQTWNRYYANSIASYISNSSAHIRKVFDLWKIKDTSALLSNLEKNQELKSVLLEETPWVLQAKNESEQKRNIALLFDMIRMSEQLNASYAKLKEMQSSNGGFVWFTGGPDDRYITQYIITGIGHLLKLKAVAGGQEENLRKVLEKAIPYLDRKLKEDYDQLVKEKVNLKTYAPGSFIIQYLYMRSFFPDYALPKEVQTAYAYFKGRVQQTWTSQSKYMQGMIALALYRANDQKTSTAILRSLKETAIINEEMGMYYKDQRVGWFWYEAPIETQSLLIEAFAEAGKDTASVNGLRTWLLKNKQTNNWKTTKATAEACYALLLQGTNWLDNRPPVTITLGNMSISAADPKLEGGTGYFKKIIEGNRVSPDMGNIAVTVGSGQAPITAIGPSWGSVYWQYFEDMDKITSASTPLKLNKKIFVEKNTDRGPVLSPVNEGDELKVGDKIKIRIELRVDRDMEYVHMKDLRASALEPVNVLSQYKWQGGLGYYESTKDASTNFFFNYLRKGTYVFEYPLFVTHSGNFSNGITSIECMYAPEFSAHSEGTRISVSE